MNNNMTLIPYLKRLQEEPPAVIAQGLLEHLPLVKNTFVHAGLYMPLIHKLLGHVLSTDELLEDARNILGKKKTNIYLLI